MRIPYLGRAVGTEIQKLFLKDVGVYKKQAPSAVPHPPQKDLDIV